MSRIVVVGAGIGGLSAALRLARRGHRVRVLEARDQPGGLASPVHAGGLDFDGGPYVLLDRPGLSWALDQLGIERDRVPLHRLEDVYELIAGEHRLRVHADLDVTADGFERAWPGAGARYRAFVARGRQAHARLTPLLLSGRPGLLELIRLGGWRELPLLLSTLGGALRRSGLPAPVRAAIAVWTHVAGQDVAAAPAFMAFLPALIHGPGAWYPVRGFASIPAALLEACREAGVELRCGVRVTAIPQHAGRVDGVVTAAGLEPADAVVSDVGLATYLELLSPAPAGLRERLSRLPLQSPGVSAYLAVRGRPRPPYLRLRLGPDGACAFVAPAVLTPPGEPWPARLVAPLDQALATRLGPDGQEAHLDRLLAESWWREGLANVEVVARRVPATWGRAFGLHRDAMNPVMTARLMRRGRLAHRSPHVRGLYLCGAATHPGQWVSFCAISGVLAADALHADLG